MAASSLSTPEFRWRFTDAWNDGDMRAFMDLAQAPARGFFRSLPYESGRKRAAAQLAGRWVLSRGDEPPTMSVEAQAYFRQFRMLEVVVSAGAQGVAARDHDALSLMLSAIIILTKCDVLKLISDTYATGQTLSALGWSEARSAWSPRDTLTSLTDPTGVVGDSRTLLSIDPHDWWASEHGARDKQTLSYLEKRMDLAERLKPGKKPRQSVFERIARIFRWS